MPEAYIPVTDKMLLAGIEELKRRVRDGHSSNDAAAYATRVVQTKLDEEYCLQRDGQILPEMKTNFLALCEQLKANADAKKQPA